MPALPVHTCHVWWALLGDPDAGQVTESQALVRVVLRRYRATDPRRALQISLARCGRRLAMAVANDPVGLALADAARVADPAALARVALVAAEQRVLDGLPPERRGIALLHYVARKEAVLSAYGLADAAAMQQLHVSAPDAPPQLLAAPSDMPPPLQLRDLTPTAGLLAAIAVRCAQPYHVELLAAAPLLRLDRAASYADTA